MDHPQPPVELDLNSCDREPIHLHGLIQDTGFLIAVTSDWVVRYASANVAAHLGVAADALLGQTLIPVLATSALHDLRGRLQLLGGEDQAERLFGLALQDGGALYDVNMHLTDGLIVIEAEPSGADQGFDAMSALKGMISRLNRVTDLEQRTVQAARQMRAILGFARVMVYRFAEDGSGEVIAEAIQPGLPPLLGQHFPESDIPKQARELYRRNWIRLIADVDGVSVPVLSVIPEPLDLSLSTLRSVSAIHIEYLRNMGVAASLSVSIMRGERLWGLFACHHTTPRPLSLVRRAAAELFGQLFSLQLESSENAAIRRFEARARDIQTQILARLPPSTPLFESLEQVASDLARLLPCDGLLICVGGRFLLHGRTPTREESLGIVRHLGRLGSHDLCVSQALSEFHPPAADFAERAAGMMAVPISNSLRDWVLFFRQELVRKITWAGNPRKPAEVGPHGVRLTPRKSFEAWQEVVRGQSTPWVESELRVAETLRSMLLDIGTRMSGVVEERRSATSRQDLLIAELNHRVRNILGLIRALVARSKESATSLDNFVQVLSDRIAALAQAHDLLTADHWAPIALRTLLNRELEAYLNSASGRVQLQGPPVCIIPNAFSVMALLFHELTTNAAKYGALSNRHGTVSVRWTFDELGTLTVEWQERGGPPVRPPSRQGFGTTIIERSLPFELSGEADVRYELTGLRAVFSIPARFVEPGGAEPAEPAKPVAALPAVTLSGAALVVEDNALIAFDAQDMLRRLGFGAVETASSIQGALNAMAEMQFDLLLLDVNLSDESSFPVASEARRRGIPYLFASGYGEQLVLPDEFAGAIVVSKPYRDTAIAQAAARVMGLLPGPDPADPGA